MNPVPQFNYIEDQFADTSILKQQLVREITCLERQIERIRMREGIADDSTTLTYEEMIECRRKMLHNLPWQE